MERKVLISISEILIFKILNGFFTIEFHKNFEGKSSSTITVLRMDDLTKRFNTLGILCNFKHLATTKSPWTPFRAYCM
jgi:hypothetical protein